MHAANRGACAHSCIIGNQGKMAGNSKICIGLLSQLILPGFIYLMLSLWKEWLTSSKKKYTKSGVQRHPWLVFRKPQFFHTFSVIFILSNYRKCTGKSRFSKNWSWTSLHSRFRVLTVLFLWSYSFQRERIKYMNSGRNRRLWIIIQIF